ncbi:6-carboxytetrahydropterin synthase [Frankia sp. B2]|uniref:6-pyruvoyl trahydropterin synthase family protein n=1 Tax=Frankia sp. B2 TaxID=2541730 RepID=UPI00106D81A0|nr:6-carboxytetrahydropterin synthase [Frankia sp. B2]
MERAVIESRISGAATFRIGKRFTFDAAHHLPSLPADHKCFRVHGHTYTVEFVLEASELVGPGFVTDFGDLAVAGRYLAESFDHRDLNEVLDVEPTSEALAQHLAGWFLAEVEPGVHGWLVAVRVSETPSSWAEYLIGESR